MGKLIWEIPCLLCYAQKCITRMNMLEFINVFICHNKTTHLAKFTEYIPHFSHIIVLQNIGSTRRDSPEWFLTIVKLKGSRRMARCSVLKPDFEVQLYYFLIQFP